MDTDNRGVRAWGVVGAGWWELWGKKRDICNNLNNKGFLKKKKEWKKFASINTMELEKI